MSLYKYVVPARIDILKGAYIRFSQPSALNDPYEMKPYFDKIAEDDELRRGIHQARENISEEVLRQAVEMLPDRLLPSEMSKEEAHAFLKKVAVEPHTAEINQAITEYLDFLLETTPSLKPTIRQIFQECVNKQCGVLCLTETPANLLMWSHYAQNHQGFVIEFDETHDYFHQQKFPDDETGYLRRVVYANQRPCYETLKELNANDLFLTKSKHWDYEQAWRMLRTLKDADNVINVEVYLFSLPPTCIAGLILGSRMLDQTKVEIADFLKAGCRYGHVRLYQASGSETDFELEVKPISEI